MIAAYLFLCPMGFCAPTADAPSKPSHPCCPAKHAPAQSDLPGCSLLFLNTGSVPSVFADADLCATVNLQTDTHGTVLQLSNDRNFGFERDWYTGFWGTLNRHLNYDAYYAIGSGYDINFQGQRGLGALQGRGIEASSHRIAHWNT